LPNEGNQEAAQAMMHNVTIGGLHG
jgi:hypothetical protein